MLKKLVSALNFFSPLFLQMSYNTSIYILTFYSDCYLNHASHTILEDDYKL